MSDSKPLTPIAQVEILGEKFDVARNGGYHLVRVKEDDYGQPRAAQVELFEFLFGGLNQQGNPTAVAASNRAQALLDVLGKTLEALRSQRDARLGVGRGESE